MSRPLFSTGTARGGTTFFARILSVNSDVKVTSDPYLPLFRTLRTEIIQRYVDPEFDRNLPLDDYYFSKEKLGHLKAIQARDLNLPFRKEHLDKLITELKGRANLGARELLPFLDELAGDTYFELFSNGIALLERAHCAEHIKWCGFHDNWTVEFFPLLARGFVDARFFIIVRDPRAAIASAIKLRERDPELVPLLYSFAHCWRKHVAFSTLLKSLPDLEGRLMVFRYEDLVTEPEKTILEFCSFLGIQFSEAMLDTKLFRSMNGAKWQNWSHFEVPKQGIFTEGINRWRSYLSPEMIEYIEFVCDPEMQLFGYEPIEYSGGLPSTAVMFEMQKDYRIAKGWRCNHLDWDEEYSLELFRKQAIRLNKERLSMPVIEKYFLFERVYDEIINLAAS